MNSISESNSRKVKMSRKVNKTIMEKENKDSVSGDEL
jgi:hypothetical protein